MEIIVDRLLREFKVEANVGKPQVSYKETIRGTADVDMKYARQSGGKGQYGHVKIILEPNEPGKGYEFINKVVGGAIPKEYIPAVDAGIQGAMQTGVLAGYNVVDVKVTLYDGSYHEVDSSGVGVQDCRFYGIQGSHAEGQTGSDRADYEGGCHHTRRLYGRCDRRSELQPRSDPVDGGCPPAHSMITAFVPLSEMFGYATDLRSKTQGRGQYVMEPSHFQEVPKSISETIISNRAKQQ